MGVGRRLRRGELLEVEVEVGEIEVEKVVAEVAEVEVVKIVVEVEFVERAEARRL